jgi:hypothetical protein
VERVTQRCGHKGVAANVLDQGIAKANEYVEDFLDRAIGGSLQQRRLNHERHGLGAPEE